MTSRLEAFASHAPLSGALVRLKWSRLAFLACSQIEPTVAELSLPVGGEERAD